MAMQSNHFLARWPSSVTVAKETEVLMHYLRVRLQLHIHIADTDKRGRRRAALVLSSQHINCYCTDPPRTLAIECTSQFRMHRVSSSGDGGAAAAFASDFVCSLSLRPFASPANRHEYSQKVNSGWLVWGHHPLQIVTEHPQCCCRTSSTSAASYIPSVVPSAAPALWVEEKSPCIDKNF